jgi:hypothetical protein
MPLASHKFSRRWLPRIYRGDVLKEKTKAETEDAPRYATSGQKTDDRDNRQRIGISGRKWRRFKVTHIA